MRASRTTALIAWALYDWANSAFPTLIQTFIFATYFTTRVAEQPARGSAQWGAMLAVAGVVVAIGSPLLGAMADRTGARKPWIAGFTAVAVLATALLWTITPGAQSVWPALALVGAGSVCVEFATTFYHAMLPELAPASHIGRWSGWGWSTGYAGGLACLAAALVLFINPHPWIVLPHEHAQHVRATFLLVAAWYGLFALPLLLVAPDVPRTGVRLREAAGQGARQLWASLRQVRAHRDIAVFLIARMLYIDGLATVFAFGGVYAATVFGMPERDLLLFGIGLNVTAACGAAVCAVLDDRVGSQATIQGSLAALIACLGALVLVRSVTWFWIIGLVMGLFVGPVQAASRSWMARRAPEPLRLQMFGLFALSGRATAFAGPLAVGWVIGATGSQRLGMSTVLIFLVGGALLLAQVRPPCQTFRRSGILTVD